MSAVPDGPIVEWTAADLSAAIHGRAVSCVEVMTAHLDHIDRVNPPVNAIVSMRPREVLLAEAREKDARLAGGHSDGWMHGFPHAVKDLADVAGMPTSHGLVHPSWGVPDPAADTPFVARLRAAGAIFIGKTNVPELGMGSQTYNRVFGATGNAYDPARTAGGSSGGAAVAVALRMVPVADGSDFMGSLRNPPGWNNVFGMRPSFGRVPSTGDAFVDQGGVDGPIARTAHDLARLLATMAGPDPVAPLSIEQDPAQFIDIAGDVRGRRVAWLGDLGGYLPMEPDVLTVTTAALAHFEQLGMHVEHHQGLPTAPGFAGNDDLWPTWLTYRHWLAGMSVTRLRDLGLFDRLKPEARFEYDGLVGNAGGPALTAVDVHQNSQRRTAMYHAFRELFRHVDYVVLPTAQVMPFPVEVHWPAEIEGRPMSSYHRWMEVTAIGTLIGAPVLAMPAGCNAAGLPIGLQVIGRHHDERSLLTLALAWEQQTQFVQRLRPPLLRNG